ncbi:hypothetical protein DOTSEDRAFT_73337 [Dothistroma septosporum NZE10]|uniref:SnoaL-like domain-containing protein n=1 Tax=Dothistroma septosporum (strain NZE10 / CBS 128990) TaxID=675120 RepID=N1PK23_DOTSN|nr:hypothetical protein DOTSEDRAFT_73337 [Dothistroma septosporum NZE10]
MPGPASDTLITTADSTFRGAQETIEYLEALTWSFMEAHNRRDVEFMRRADFLSPSWTAALEHNKPKPSYLEEHIQEHYRLVELFPDRICRWLDASTSLDLEHGLATVYINMELTGSPPGVVHTGIVLYEWQLVQQKWVCVKMIGMRGSGDSK